MAINPKWAIEAGAGIAALIVPLGFPTMPIWAAIIAYLVAAGLIGYGGGKLILDWRAAKKRKFSTPVPLSTEEKAQQ